jgi:murein DD-endopeptidase MepM/ murein hydrolase activator NlpD
VKRTILAATLLATLCLLAPSRPAEARLLRVGIALPAPAGTTWTILDGYYTEMHTGVDPFALDIERSDAPTAGTPVLAPVSGRIRYRGDTCVAVEDALGLSVLICHLTPQAGLATGDPVLVGDRLGVANGRNEDNRWRAHLHIAVHRTLLRTSRYDTVPFAGPYALEGRNLPKIIQYNAYAGLSFVSTNGPDPAAAMLDSVLLPEGFTHVQWQGASLSPDLAFFALPDLVAVYAWRPRTLQSQVYRPGSLWFLSTLQSLEPGDLLWLNLRHTAVWSPELSVAQAQVAQTR